MGSLDLSQEVCGERWYISSSELSEVINEGQRHDKSTRNFNHFTVLLKTGIKILQKSFLIKSLESIKMQFSSYLGWESVPKKLIHR